MGTGHMKTLRNIIEKSKEWLVPKNLQIEDFERDLDSFDRNGMSADLSSRSVKTICQADVRKLK